MGRKHLIRDYWQWAELPAAVREDARLWRAREAEYLAAEQRKASKHR